jgi:hypothetical protein
VIFTAGKESFEMINGANLHKQIQYFNTKLVTTEKRNSPAILGIDSNVRRAGGTSVQVQKKK